MSADNRRATQITGLTFRQRVPGSEASQGASSSPGETSQSSSLGEGPRMGWPRLGRGSGRVTLGPLSESHLRRQGRMAGCPTLNAFSRPTQ